MNQITKYAMIVAAFCFFVLAGSLLQHVADMYRMGLPSMMIVALVLGLACASFGLYAIVKATGGF